MWAGFAADLWTLEVHGQANLLRLEHLLRAVDRLGAVRVQLDSDGVTVTGSKGQLRPHPLLLVEQALRREVGTGLVALGLAAPGRYGVEVGPDGRMREER